MLSRVLRRLSLSFKKPPFGVSAFFIFDYFVEKGKLALNLGGACDNLVKLAGIV